MRFRFSVEVEKALEEGKAVVALESTIISHGMPYPENLECAIAVEDIVRSKGAVPATIAILNGQVCVGLNTNQLEKLARLGTACLKVSRRDLAFVTSLGYNGACTVAATMFIAHQAGIRVFVTGGIGGVHRGVEETFDISADLSELARTPVAVVCAGAKSLLDLPKTIELLETAGVPVIGYQTDKFPAFFTRSSNLPVSATCTNPVEVANVIKAQMSLKIDTGMIIACPIPHGNECNDAEAATVQAVAEANKNGVRGKYVTPFLLKRVNELTRGSSLASNLVIIKNNASIGSEIAVALSSNPGITVIGGACVDFMACADTLTTNDMIATSTPGVLRKSVGGVGRNIAECMSRLGAQISFFSVIGDDSNGQVVTRNIQELGMINKIRVMPSAATATYTGVVKRDGSLLAAVIDASIFRRVKEEHLTDLITKDTRLVVTDTNWAEKTLGVYGEVCMNGKVELWIDTVSTAKAVKILAFMDKLSVVRANKDEIHAIARSAGISESDPAAICAKLINTRKLACSFIVSTGASGAVLVTSGKVGYLPASIPKDAFDHYSDVQISRETIGGCTVVRYCTIALPREFVIDATGSGDCLTGAAAWARSIGLPLELCVPAGLIAARAAVKSSHPVNKDLSSADLRPCINFLTRQVPSSKM